MWTQRFLIILLLSTVATISTAFDREFPASAKRGSMTPAPYPSITIDGVLRNLSPGARIWNQDNMIEMPTALRGNNLDVKYTENNDGDIDRIWILNHEEVQQSSFR